MSPWIRRSALFCLLLSFPAVASPPREDHRSARIRPVASHPEAAEVQPGDGMPLAAADAGGVDFAGLLGMLTALTVTFVYARSQRVSAGRGLIRPDGSRPPDLQ